MNKKEKIKLVPKYRFPEFQNSDSWDRCTLVKLADRIEEKVGENKLTTLSISAGTGFVSQEEKFSRDISGNQYKNYIHLRKGDFSYNKGNSKTFPQGCIYELTEYEEAAVPNAFISFHFKDNYVSNFYKGYFENNFHGKQLTRFITSGARMDGLLNIKAPDFFSIVLPTPTERKEQQKIADCLASIDDLIYAEDKKLSALKDHKKGLMQKLFPAEGKTVPEWRFPEFRNCMKWEKALVLELVSTILPPKKLNSSEYYTSGEFPVIDQGQNYFCGWTNDREALVKLNCKLLIFGDHTCILKLINRPFAQGADGIKILLTNKKILPDFLFQYLSFDPVKLDSYKRHFSILKEKYIFFPNIESGEQQKIADFLSSVDELITAQADKIEALKKHKIGLMQGLFPSIEEVIR